METNLVRPEITANQITGKSGKVYTIYDTVSTGRYGAMTKLEAEMSAGAPITQVIQQVTKAYEALQTVKVADACVILNNVLNEAQRTRDKLPDRLMMYCTTFINAPDEDLGVWNEADAAAKIADWSDIDIRFFFRCFVLFQKAFTVDYDTYTPPILEVPLENETNESE